MIDDINRLHIELDYSEVVNFNNRYFTLSATEENFKKHNKLLIGSYIALPVYLLKYLGEDLNTAEEFLKFPLIKKPKKMSDILLNDYNIYCQPINYPTVAEGTERLRFAPTPLHTDAMMHSLVDSMRKLFKRIKEGCI